MGEMTEPKTNRTGGIRAALLALFILLTPLMVVDPAEAKYANASGDTCSVAGCHPTSADLAGSAPTITVAVENVTAGTGSVLYDGSTLSVNAGETLEIDWKYTGVGETGLSDHPVWLPSGWVPSKGTANTPAITGWNTVWDATGGITVSTPDPWRSTHNGMAWPVLTGSANSPDGYWVDYTGSIWDATGLADDSGATADQDLTASTMGTDMRVTVPSGATTGTYYIHVFGSGKGLDSSKNAKATKGSIEQIITLSVTGGSANTNPDAPLNPAQYQSDGATLIALGGYATSTTVVFEGDLSDPDADNVKLQIDYNGDSTSDCESALVASGTTNVQASCAGLVDGTGYDWQYRAVDANSAASAWTAFDAGTPDFTVDATAPTVSSTNPTNGATGVALDSQVTINWSENVDCTTVNTTNITSDSPTWTLNSCTGSQAIYDTAGQTASTTYNVNVTTAVTDLAGNPMSAAYGFSYTTAAGANTNPDAPLNPAQYQSDGTTAIAVGGYATSTTVVFGGDLSDPDGDTVKLQIDYNADSTSDCESALVASGSTNVQASCAGLVDGTGYDWQYRAVDANGGASAWTAFDASTPDFTVDATAPTVSSTNPANGATGVALDSQVTINWSENVDCTTVNTTNITSDSPTWTLNSCTGSQAIFDTAGQTASTTYNVNVTTAITDVAGNPMSAAYGFSYTTAAAADTTPPNVSSTVPTNGATGVALDSQVTINWDENIDCTTVNTTNITSDSPTWTLNSCSGSQAIFDTAGQANSTTYNVNVTTAVTDVAGNPMSAAYPFSYTTVAPAGVNTTSAGTASATPGNTVIDVSAPYTDDDNADNTVTIDWGQDGVDFSLGTQTLTHAASPYTYQITGLTNGTAYQVRVTYNDADGVTGTNPQTITGLTPVSTNPLLHNSINTESGKWSGSGGWGISGAKYGEFTCATCHTKSTTNIKRVKTSISTPDGTNWGGPGTPSVSVTFLSAVEGSSDFGDDSTTHASSTKVCEVCHSYDATQAQGVKQHAYSMSVTASHYNQGDCTTCHKHNQGFDANGDCNACHGYPPKPGDGFSYLATEGKGAHGPHYNHITVLAGVTPDPTVDQFGDATVTAVCGVCHDMAAATHETGGGTRNINFNGSTTYQFGASAPAYNGSQGVSSSTTPKTCSSVSCHFKTTPVWE